MQIKDSMTTGMESRNSDGKNERNKCYNLKDVKSLGVFALRWNLKNKKNSNIQIYLRWKDWNDRGKGSRKQETYKIRGDSQ